MTTIEVRGILKSENDFPLKTFLKLNSDDYVYVQITIMNDEK